MPGMDELTADQKRRFDQVNEFHSVMSGCWSLEASYPGTTFEASDPKWHNSGLGRVAEGLGANFSRLDNIFMLLTQVFLTGRRYQCVWDQAWFRVAGRLDNGYPLNVEDKQLFQDGEKQVKEFEKAKQKLILGERPYGFFMDYPVDTYEVSSVVSQDGGLFGDMVEPF
jgi:hypothetical protein